MKFMTLTRQFFSLFILICLVATSCTLQKVDLGPMREENLQEEEYFFLGSDLVFDHPLSLNEIITIAVCNNLELMVQAQEVAINAELASQEHLKMLPNLGANYRYTERDRNTASFSQSLVPGVPPAPLSISRDRFINTWSFEFSWTLLDFGLAYFRWHQEANRTLMLKIQYERLQQNLILDIVRFYWNAVAARKAFEGAKAVLGRVYSQKELYRTKRGLRIISDLVGLAAENRLVDVELDLVRYERLYHEALMELAERMGIPPTPSFEIEIPDIAYKEVDIADLKTLQETALLNRPELYEKDVEELVTLDEINATTLEIFPNLRLFATPNYDSNTFLLFNTWFEIGLQTAWNLLAMPARYKARQAAIEGTKKVKVERLATALGVLTQVNLAQLMLKDYIREYEVAKEALRIKTELASAYQKRRDKGIFSEAETLIYDSDAYFAEIRVLESYTAIQSTLEQLNNSIGLPLYYQITNEYDAAQECEACSPSY